MKTFRLLSVAVCALGLAGAANAATFDFAADAETFFNNNTAQKGDAQKNYEGTFEQVYGSGGATDGTITVQASATKTVNGQEVVADPFMDSRGNGDNDDVAGLGVCSSGLTQYDADPGVSVDLISNCSTNFGTNTGDDNLVSPEILKLTFSDSVDSENVFLITELFIRDSGHDPISGEDVISINGMMFDASLGVVDLTGLGPDTMFFFTSTDGADPELYIATISVEAVPLPAAGLLLLGGLGGLAAMKRRKKA